MTHGRANFRRTFFGGSGLGSPVDVTNIVQLGSAAAGLFCLFVLSPLLSWVEDLTAGMSFGGRADFGPARTDVDSGLTVRAPCFKGGSSVLEVVTLARVLRALATLPSRLVGAWV